MYNVTISARELLHVGGEILQLTHKDRNDGCVHFATVCASMAKPDRALKSERGSGLKLISGFVPAAKILQLVSDWTIGNCYPLLPVV